jgi:hypothetical protein
VLDPDQQARIGRGQQVTYPHYLTNRGNCSETVRVSLDFLTNNRHGWTATAWIDNRSSGGASVAGVVDSSDAQVLQGWTVTLAPGEAASFDFTAPEGTRVRAIAYGTPDTKVENRSIDDPNIRITLEVQEGGTTRFVVPLEVVLLGEVDG